MGQDHEAHKEFEFYPIKSSVLGRLVGYTVANETITKNSGKMLQKRNKREIIKYLTMAAIPRMEASKILWFVWVNDKHEQVWSVSWSH